MDQARINTIHAVYKKHFKDEPASFVIAPGRINLIGEHTDYSEGFVLPVAIDRDVAILFSPRQDDFIRVYSVDFDEFHQMRLFDLEKQKSSWIDYLQGIIWALSDEGYPLKGWQGVISGNIPIGAGLSSSAALEIAIVKTFILASNISIDPTHLALIALKAERDWIGLNVGIMDQLISADAKVNHAMLLDCKTLDYKFIPIPENVSFIVMDTLTRRELTQSAYNIRHKEIQEVTRLLNVNSLRETNQSDLDARQTIIPEILYKRTKHVISENSRVLQFVHAMQNHDLRSMGELINESHASLRDDYEVSSDALNLIVDLAKNQSACFGARLMGAGFGGCALALVSQGEESGFIHEVKSAYQDKAGIAPSLFIVKSANGVHTQELNKK
ncbi:MAG TPA: galactokinase [Brevefilum sp.]|nr:galactokinase [Brevefilum sp.]